MIFRIGLVAALVALGLKADCSAEVVEGTLIDRVLESSTPSRYEIPNFDDATESSDWFLPSYNVESWRNGSGGIGYERSSSNTYTPFIDTDVETLMYNLSSSIYIRTTFEISNLQADQYLVLQMRYDDAFIAYLNGHEVARSPNAPITPSDPSGSPHPDTEATLFSVFDLRDSKEHMIEGENLLAIHGFNFPATSSDFLMEAQIDRFDTLTPEGDCFEKLASNPAKDHLGVAAIHSLKAFNGKIYMGFGEWNGHPGPIVLCAYDPVAHRFTMEHSINSDSIGVMREIDGKLWIPSVDPIHYSRFTDLSILHPDGRLEQRTPVAFYHLFDVIERSNGELWMMGSKDANETPTDGGVIYRSFDRGESWEEITPGFNNDPSRYYWGFELDGEVHFESATYNSNTGWRSNTIGSDKIYKATEITGAGGTRTCYKLDQSPGGTSGSSTLAMATTGSTFYEAVYAPMLDFATRGAEAFVLRRDAKIEYCPDLTVADRQWQTLDLAGIPADARAIEVSAGNIYLGTGSGDLLGIGLDGTLLGGLATVENRVPDQFGHCIVIDGDTMAVGTPGETGTLTQSGRAQLFERDGVDGEWMPGQTITPPTEHFGGFFGDSIALDGDTMVILESGVIASGERGQGSLVHAYVKGADDIWTLEASEAIIFAQSVAIADGTLYVGQRNAFRTYTLPNLGYVSYTETTSFYESYATLAVGTYDNDRTVVFHGSSGDTSRAGAPGAVTATFPDSGTTGSIISIDSQSRHGFSVAQSGQLVAVGEPRADFGTDLLQAGSVAILAAPGEFGELYSELFPSVVAVDAEAEDGFGHSVSLGDNGDLLLVGAPLSRGPDGERRGAAYLYRFITGQWKLLRKFTPETDKPGTWEFGSSVLIDGETGIIGSGFTDGSLNDLERLGFVDLNQPLPQTFADWAAERNLIAPNDDASADPDGNGIDNLTEFALGNGQNFQPVMRRSTTGQQVFHHRQRASAACHGLHYFVEVSSDLITWEPANSTSQGSSVEWRDMTTTLTGDQRYARLRITLFQ